MRTLYKKAVIFSAPQGWGKTFHATKLQQAFGCDSVVDDWSPGMPLVDGALHLTNCSAEFVRDSRYAGTCSSFSSFDDAIVIDSAWSRTAQNYLGLQVAS